MQKGADVNIVTWLQLKVTDMYILQHFTCRLMATLWNLQQLYQKGKLS